MCKRKSLGVSMFRMIKKFIEKGILLISIFFCKITNKKRKIKSNRIFVTTFDHSYTCNPKYIVEEILHRKLPVEIVWAYSEKTNMDNFPPEIRLVKTGTIQMVYAQVTAKVWIDNAINCVWYFLPKNIQQIYINTWHGSLGIKKLGGNEKWMNRARQCGELTDYCVTNSQFEENVFRDTFWTETEFWKCGHARNDILFRKNDFNEIRKKVCTLLGIPQDKKILLYAPTFRDSGETNCFNIDFQLLKRTLEEKFLGEWVILLRMHHKNKEVSKSYSYNEWLVDASTYFDMQELLAVVDAGITDYSSWAYDYMLTKRPLFLYVPDLDMYDQARGFYYPIETTPFPIAQTNDELEYVIKKFDNVPYQEKIDAFLVDKGCYDVGIAAKNIVDKIEEIMMN